MYIYIWQRLINPVTVNSKRTTVPPKVAQVDPSRAIHTSPRVHMRQQTCLPCDTADMSAV